MPEKYSVENGASMPGEAQSRVAAGWGDLALPCGRGIEDTGLHLGGQRRVDGQDDELRHGRPQALHAVPQHLARAVYLFLPCAAAAMQPSHGGAALPPPLPIFTTAC